MYKGKPVFRRGEAALDSGLKPSPAGKRCKEPVVGVVTSRKSASLTDQGTHGTEGQGWCVPVYLGGRVTQELEERSVIEWGDGQSGQDSRHSEWLAISRAPL